MFELYCVFILGIFLLSMKVAGKILWSFKEYSEKALLCNAFIVLLNNVSLIIGFWRTASKSHINVFVAWHSLTQYLESQQDIFVHWSATQQMILNVWAEFLLYWTMWRMIFVKEKILKHAEESSQNILLMHSTAK